MNVMLIDDSAVMRKVLVRTLRQGGMTVDGVHEAGSGDEALELLAGKPSLDFILCDWNMPGMSGLDFVAKAIEAGNEVPIIMVTTESGDERRAQARAAGASGFVSKPFTADSLCNSICATLGVTLA